jgi:hypothetical protein
MTDSLRRAAPRPLHSISTAKAGQAHHARQAPAPAATKATGWAPKAAATPQRAPRADLGTPTPPTTTTAVTAPGVRELTDLSEPTMMNAQLADPPGSHGLAEATGPLFVNDTPSPGDVNQGSAGDCYFLSTMATIANTHPEVIKNMIAKNDDGSYTVTFKRDNGRGGTVDVPVKVDDKFYTETAAADGSVFAVRPEYGSSTNNAYTPGTAADAPRTEQSLWLPLVEKAYAKFKGGSYENIGNGGWPRNVMSEVMGRPSTTFDTANTPAADTFNRIKAAVDSKSPICASTRTDDASVADYTNTGLVHGHAYAVLGASEHDGDKFVTLRNPWGNTEPGNDGKNDGVFEMKLSDFMKYYNTVDISPARP